MRCSLYFLQYFYLFLVFSFMCSFFAFIPCVGIGSQRSAQLFFKWKGFPDAFSLKTSRITSCCHEEEAINLWRSIRIYNFFTSSTILKLNTARWIPLHLAFFRTFSIRTPVVASSCPENAHTVPNFKSSRTASCTYSAICNNKKFSLLNIFGRLAEHTEHHSWGIAGHPLFEYRRNDELFYERAPWLRLFRWKIQILKRLASLQANGAKEDSIELSDSWSSESRRNPVLCNETSEISVDSSSSLQFLKLMASQHPACAERITLPPRILSEKSFLRSIIVPCNPKLVNVTKGELWGKDELRMCSQISLNFHEFVALLGQLRFCYPFESLIINKDLYTSLKSFERSFLSTAKETSSMERQYPFMRRLIDDRLKNYKDTKISKMGNAKPITSPENFHERLKSNSGSPTVIPTLESLGVETDTLHGSEAAVSLNNMVTCFGEILLTKSQETRQVFKHLLADKSGLMTMRSIQDNLFKLLHHADRVLSWSDFLGLMA